MPSPVAIDAPPFPARIRLYRENRRRFRPEQLQPFAGDWVAFSADGIRIVASDKMLGNLEARLAALGIDPQEVLFEQIEVGAATGSAIS